jgi:hypothetical protein
MCTNRCLFKDITSKALSEPSNGDSNRLMHIIQGRKGWKAMVALIPAHSVSCNLVKACWANNRLL